MYMPFSKFTLLSLLMAARWPVQSPDKSTQKPEAQKARKWEARANSSVDTFERDLNNQDDIWLSFLQQSKARSKLKSILVIVWSYFALNLPYAILLVAESVGHITRVGSSSNKVFQSMQVLNHIRSFWLYFSAAFPNRIQFKQHIHTIPSQICLYQ